MLKRKTNGDLSSLQVLAPTAAQVGEFIAQIETCPGVLSAAANTPAELQSIPPDDSSYTGSWPLSPKPQAKYMSSIGACCSNGKMAAPAGQPGASTPTSFVDAWSLDVWSAAWPAAGGILSSIDRAQPAATVLNPVKIAILDSGIAPLKPELQNVIGSGWDFSDSTVPAGKEITKGNSYDAATPTTGDTAGSDNKKRHGTKVASIIAAVRNNKTTIAGLAPIVTKGDGSIISAVTLHPYIISKLNPVPAGSNTYKLTQDLLSVTKALTKIAGAGPNDVPDIVLLPLTFPNATPDTSSSLAPLIQSLVNKGILVVASARKDEKDNKKMLPPAGLPNVLRVGGWGSLASPIAADSVGTTSPQSDILDVVAPAKKVSTAYRDSKFYQAGQEKDFEETDGQSVAAAFVAGAAALRLFWQQRLCTTQPDAAAKVACVGELLAGIAATAWKPPAPAPAAADELVIYNELAPFLGQGMLSVPTLLSIPQETLTNMALAVPDTTTGTMTTVVSTWPIAEQPQIPPPTADAPILTVQFGTPDWTLPIGLPASDYDKVKYVYWVDGEKQTTTHAALKIDGTQEAIPGIELPKIPGSPQKRRVDVAMIVPGYGTSLAVSFTCKEVTPATVSPMHCAKTL